MMQKTVKFAKIAALTVAAIIVLVTGAAAYDLSNDTPEEKAARAARIETRKAADAKAKADTEAAEKAEAEQKAKQEEEARVKAEQEPAQKAAEAARIAEEARKQEEARKAAEEAAKQEEARKAAEEAAKRVPFEKWFAGYFLPIANKMQRDGKFQTPAEFKKFAQEILPMIEAATEVSDNYQASKDWTAAQDEMSANLIQFQYDMEDVSKAKTDYEIKMLADRTSATTELLMMDMARLGAGF